MALICTVPKYPLALATTALKTCLQPLLSHSSSQPLHPLPTLNISLSSTTPPSYLSLPTLPFIVLYPSSTSDLHRRTYTLQSFLPSTPTHDHSTSISLVPLARRRHAFTFSIYPPPSARKSHPLPHLIHHSYITYGEWFIESPSLSSAHVAIHCTKTDKYLERNSRKQFGEVNSNPIINLDHG